MDVVCIPFTSICQQSQSSHLRRVLVAALESLHIKFAGAFKRSLSILYMDNSLQPAQSLLYLKTRYLLQNYTSHSPYAQDSCSSSYPHTYLIVTLLCPSILLFQNQSVSQNLVCLQVCYLVLYHDAFALNIYSNMQDPLSPIA